MALFRTIFEPAKDVFHLFLPLFEKEKQRKTRVSRCVLDDFPPVFADENSKSINFSRNVKELIVQRLMRQTGWA